VFKWRSDTIETIARWGSPTSGKYSLAFAIGELSACDLGADEYCALVGFKRVPVHSDFHDAKKSSEVAEALRIGLSFAKPNVHGLDREGTIKYRVQRFRERSEGNRLHVLEEKGTRCEVCGFDFVAQYGSLFKPSAHVHHKNPLALGERQALSVDEFAVLCAPCHVAIHMGLGRALNPWSIDELKLMISRRWDIAR
jgi:5-methylcytosine-specific restriction endonuclease McrA